MSDLGGNFTALRDDADQVAQRAARLAVAETMGSLPPPTAPDTDRFAGRSEIEDIRAAQAQAEHRTHETLQAMHETLSRMVARVAGMETLAAERRAAEAAGTNASVAHASRAAAPSGGRGLETTSRDGRGEPDIIRGRRDTGDRAADARPLQLELTGSGATRTPTGPMATDHRDAAAALGLFDEPAAPRRAPQVSAPPPVDRNDVKASFIAAARRAAQAAAADTTQDLSPRLDESRRARKERPARCSEGAQAVFPRSTKVGPDGRRFRGARDRRRATLWPRHEPVRRRRRESRRRAGRAGLGRDGRDREDASRQGRGKPRHRACESICGQRRPHWIAERQKRCGRRVHEARSGRGDDRRRRLERGGSRSVFQGGPPGRRSAGCPAAAHRRHRELQGHSDGTRHRCSAPSGDLRRARRRLRAGRAHRRRAWREP